MSREEILQFFKNIPAVETKRLLLRRMQKSDSSDMYLYSSKPEVTKYLLWEPHISEAYTYKYLAYLQGAYRNGKFYDWAVTLKNDGTMIGTCGFTKFDFASNSAEVGYVINPYYWGNEYAPEALMTVLNIGFEVFGLHRIEAKYIVGNEKSRRVMEKVGMKFEGVTRDSLYLRGQYKSVGICSIIESEYKSFAKR